MRQEAPRTGPVRISIEGLIDVFVPADERFGRIFYDATGESTAPAQIELFAETPPEAALSSGVSLIYYGTSGAADFPETTLSHAEAGYNGGQDDWTSVTGTIDSSGVRLEGTVNLHGATRKVTLMGPLYRACLVEDPNPGGSSSGGTKTVPIDGTKAVIFDPSFDAPECQRFK